ncbi:hypothetical protein E0495_01475 [Wolbachia pipientis]|uniref:Uncharacterized protein n=1 Tax=Wolbachia pipientis TaxID=955 RepID=A0A6I6CJ18_WOLPI|nr:WPE palindromic element domain-containing protein [Wolbachia endosymbiont (group A) of Merzomyia westermanni]MBS9528929.1 hypothetical protein [Wolbachia endosymbiont of Ceratitis capitata]QGT15981.1 hypothetical protein E0495_01475 [Wolbachia pipientis]
MSSQCPDYLDPEDLILTKWLHNKGWIPVSSTGMTLQGHWDDIILFSGFQTGMTAVLRHTVTVSLDPANKQRDDGCQGVSYLDETLSRSIKSHRRKLRPIKFLILRFYLQYCYQADQ